MLIAGRGSMLAECAAFRHPAECPRMAIPERDWSVWVHTVILAAVGVIMVGYLAVGFAGYLAYPTSVDSNVLKSFPTRPLLLKVPSSALYPRPLASSGISTVAAPGSEHMKDQPSHCCMPRARKP